MSSTSLTLREGAGRWGWTRWFSGWWDGLFNPQKGEQLTGPQRVSTTSGTSVSDTTAMTIAAVFRCIRIISETAGSLPLIAYKRLPGGDREELEGSHWLARLIREPNETMTGDEWREAMHSQMCGWGNAYSQIVLNDDPKGRKPVELWPYQVVNMHVHRREDRTLQYQYPDAEGTLRDLPAGKVLHLRAFSLDGVTGLSPLAYARNTLGLAAAAEQYAAGFFSSGGRPSGVMNSDKLLNEGQREQIRKQFSSMAEGGDGKKFWLLEAGLNYTAISVSPEDMQMLETRAFQIADIARFFGVPLFLLMETEKSTSWGTGIEQQNMAFLTYTLRSYLTRVESTFNRFVIPAADRASLFVEHDVAPLLRADSKARSEFYSTMVQNGIMKRGEARRRENLPAIVGADPLTCQVNLTPLELLGKQPPRPAATVEQTGT